MTRAVAWSFGGAIAAFTLAGGVLIAIDRAAGYQGKPRPAGSVLVVRIGGELWSALGTTRTRVEVVQREPAILAVHDTGSPPFGSEDFGTPKSVATLSFEYPSGRRRSLGEQGAQPLVAKLPFDFDADGVEDEVTSSLAEGRSVSRVEVLSGATGAVLFRDDDPHLYTQVLRGFPLGDLDGDGFAELALLHPRCDRSGFDMVLGDDLLGARSWLSVVSGKAACAAR